MMRCCIAVEHDCAKYGHVQRTPVQQSEHMQVLAQMLSYGVVRCAEDAPRAAAMLPQPRSCLLRTRLGSELHSKHGAALTATWGVRRKRQNANWLCVAQLACRIHHKLNFIFLGRLMSRKLKDQNHAALLPQTATGEFRHAAAPFTLLITQHPLTKSWCDTSTSTRQVAQHLLATACMTASFTCERSNTRVQLLHRTPLLSLMTLVAAVRLLYLIFGAALVTRAGSSIAIAKNLWLCVIVFRVRLNPPCSLREWPLLHCCGVHSGLQPAVQESAPARGQLITNSSRMQQHKQETALRKRMACCETNGGKPRSALP